MKKHNLRKKNFKLLFLIHLKLTEYLKNVFLISINIGSFLFNGHRRIYWKNRNNFNGIRCL